MCLASHRASRKYGESLTPAQATTSTGYTTCHECVSRHRPSMIVVAAAMASLPGCGGRSTTRVEPVPQMSTMPPEHMPAETGSREQTAYEQVNHVLNRLTFGARPGDAEAVRAMGVDRWIDLQ